MSHLTVPSRSSVRFNFILALVAMLGFVALCPPTLSAQNQKTVQGRVVGSSDQPQPGAIVYLKNEKTGDIKSFISIQDGTYRFGQLSPESDYQLWAEYKGKKSATKTVSSFDSKKLVIYQLKVDTGS